MKNLSQSDIDEIRKIVREEIERAGLPRIFHVPVYVPVYQPYIPPYAPHPFSPYPTGPLYMTSCISGNLGAGGGSTAGLICN